MILMKRQKLWDSEDENILQNEYQLLNTVEFTALSCILKLYIYLMSQQIKSLTKSLKHHKCHD